MTRQEIAVLVALAAGNHPHVQDLGATADLWLMMLGDLPFDVAKTALGKVLATSRFFPTVAEIREAAASLRPAGAPEPELAWAEVLDQIRRVGAYGTPVWSHPAVGRAAEALYGGWLKLCENLMTETLGVDRAHYMRIYATLAQREREAALLPPAVREMAAQLAAGMAAPAVTGRAETAAEPPVVDLRSQEPVRKLAWCWVRDDDPVIQSPLFNNPAAAQTWRDMQSTAADLRLVAVSRP